MRICRQISTNVILEMQSGDNAPLGTLKQNQINAGFDETDLEEMYVTQAEFDKMEKDAIPLSQYKADRIKKLKNEGKDIIYAKWSVEDQLNINAGMASSVGTKAEKDADIETIKGDYNIAKNAIKNAVDKNAVDAVTINWTQI